MHDPSCPASHSGNSLHLGLRAGFALLFAIAAALPAALPAQTTQDSPQAVPAPVQAPHVESHDGSVSGSVADTTGALIPGATVTLAAPGAQDPMATIKSDAEGRFTFDGLRRGEYEITVAVPGFAPYTSKRISLVEVEPREIIEVRLPLAVGTADVEVTVTRREIASEEIHAAEKQRVLGIFPNFYTSFVWNAEPLDTRQKFSLALHATTDPVAFITAAAVAGAEQYRNTFPAYGDDAASYFKRYGAAYADGFVGKIIGSAILPSVFRQDPRYFYLGTGTMRQRALYAITSSVIARGNNGRNQPNYSHILGNAAAGALSGVYHPDESSGKLALDNALIGIGGQAAVNLCREFLLKPFTHGIATTPKP